MDYIQGLVNKDCYLAYRKSLSPREQAICLDREKVLCDPGFWSSIRAFAKVCLPATVTLRLMDKSVPRAKDVNGIWQALGNHLGLVLSEDTESLPLEMKNEIYRLFETIGTKSNQQVFDAAWALDPVNLPVIRKWAMERSSEEEQSEWQRIRKDTHIVLDLMIKRSVLVQLSNDTKHSAKASRQVSDMDVADASMRVIDSDQFDREVDKTSSKLEDEFVWYYGGFGQYESLRMSSEQDWAKSDGILKYYALRVVNMACTISKVERLHRCSASMHNASGNRVNLDRLVDRIDSARLIRRSQQLDSDAWFDASSLEKFEVLSPEQEVALVQWGHRIKVGLRIVQQTIQDPFGTSSLSKADISEGEDSDDEEEIFVDQEQERTFASDAPNESVPVMPVKLMEAARKWGLS